MYIREKYKYLPESNEVRQARCHDEETIHESVAEEEHEKLVVVEANAVVDPRTVVVHFEDTTGANAAVVGAVGLHEHAPVAVADRA